MADRPVVESLRDREMFDRGYLAAIEDLEKFGKSQGLRTCAMLLGAATHLRRKVQWMMRRNL